MQTQPTTTLDSSKLLDHPKNPRGKLRPEDVADILPSIKERGVIVPILVTPVSSEQPQTYHIIAGHRRNYANTLAGNKTISANVITGITPAQAYELLAIENEQRKDFTPAQRCQMYKTMMEEYKYKPSDIAEKLNISTRTVYDALTFDKLITPLREMLTDGRITYSHAVLAARLDKEQQIDAQRRLQVHQFSIREFDQFIHREYLIDLGNAPFNQNDAELAKEAGPCTGCPDRMEEGKKITCLDSKCYRTKITAHINRTAQQLTAKGQQPVLILDDYLSVSDRTAITKTYLLPIIDLNNWKEAAAKSCKTATIGILLTGDNAGNTITVCHDKKCKKHFPQAAANRSTAKPKSKKQIAKELAAAAREKRTACINQRLHEGIYLAAARAKITKLPTAIIDRIADSVSPKFFGKNAAEINKQAAPYLEKITLEKEICLAIIVQSMSYEQHRVYPDTLKIAAGIGINHKQLLKKIEKEYDAAQKPTANSQKQKAKSQQPNALNLNLNLNP